MRGQGTTATQWQLHRAGIDPDPHWWHSPRWWLSPSRPPVSFTAARP